MKFIIYIFFLFFALTACKNNSQKKSNDAADINEKLTNMNRIMVSNESKVIEDFIVRHSFKTTQTGTGLRYEIYIHGKGEKPSIHNEVEIKYRMYLLDGKLCYSTDSAGSVKFSLGEGEQVRGLEEGLMLMIPGDKAHLILPAHLAFGISGDQVKVPPASSVYYDVELLNVKK